MRRIAYNICLTLTLALVGAVMWLSWLTPEHLR